MYADLHFYSRNGVLSEDGTTRSSLTQPRDWVKFALVMYIIKVLQALNTMHNGCCKLPIRFCIQQKVTRASSATCMLLGMYLTENQAC